MRADRLLAIIMLLQARGKMTTHTLASELEVSRRTILRDIEALSFMGVPVYSEGGHGGGVALDEKYRTSLTGLHEEEAQTLFVTSNSKLLDDLKLGQAAERTLLKLSAALPDRYQQSVNTMRQRILIDPAWWWADAQLPTFWEALQQAVYEDRQIEAVYEHYDGEVVTRVLDPYSLVAKSSLWYLVARREKTWRTYRVSRFHRLTLLETHFRRSPEFDLGTYWNQHVQHFVEAISEYRFTLQIPASRFHFVQWLMVGRYEVIASAEDWLTLRFQVESVELAKMLIFGLGAPLIIVEPDELRQLVLQTAQDIQEALS